MQRLFTKRLSVAGFAAGLLLAASPAFAVYTITLTETGGNVVATGSGSINTTGLTNGGGGSSCGVDVINPSGKFICTGTGTVALYTGSITAPAALGTGGTTMVSSSSGDYVVLLGTSVYIKTGYVSGAALSSTTTWNSKTFATLGVTPGTYTWTLPNDTIVVQISAAAAAPVVTPPPIPTNVLMPFVAGITSQLKVLDLTSGSGPSMTTCLLSTVKQLFGGDATYVGQSSNGAAQISVGGQTISYFPLEASTDTGLGIGAFARNTNSMSVGTSCGTFRVTPAVANMTDFGKALAVLGLSVQVDANGVITATVDNKLYAVRPDYFVTQGTATGTPSLAFGGDGTLRFTDSVGKVQILRPAFLDPAGLQAGIAGALGGTIAIQTDGTAVFTRINGSQLLLVPEMVLSLAPNGLASTKWVNDKTDHYLYLVAAYYQGLTATAR